MIDDRRWHRPHPDVWTYRVPLSVLGTDAGRRGVAVRHAEGRWAFVGPVPLDARARERLDAGGVVDTLIVPTAFHNTFVAEACAAFPDAEVYLTEGAKTAGLPAARLRRLPEDFPQALKKVLLPFPLTGMRAGHEVPFVHLPSKSLIVADLCVHFPERAAGLWTRLFRRCFGWTPGCRVPTLMKFALADRDAARRTLERIRRQCPRRILMAHGVPVEDDVDAVLAALNVQLR